MMRIYRVSNAQHDPRGEGVQLVHAIDHLALEVLREVFLLPFRLRGLVQLSHEVEVLHLRPLHASDLMQAFGHFADFDQLIG